ncbi:helix-turn-helix transcriptional regulator [Nanchangia anserum]
MTTPSVRPARPSVPAVSRRPGARTQPKARYAGTMPTPEPLRRTRPVMREHLGDVLRLIRRSQGRTLREVSASAEVSLGYLSEIERGQKEASSELLYAICRALGVPLSIVLREVAERIAAYEGVAVPDTVPDNLVASAVVATS